VGGYDGAVPSVKGGELGGHGNPVCLYDIGAGAPRQLRLMLVNGVRVRRREGRVRVGGGLHKLQKAAWEPSSTCGDRVRVL
jgi:hypothetical protein